MKDKRNLLKLACLIETIYIFIMVIYYFSLGKFNDEVVASLFMLSISLIFNYILYKESKKDISYLKENKLKVIISSVWLFLEPVLPGILGFIFLFLISDKKKLKLPTVKEKILTKGDKLIQIVLFLLFMVVMFVLPLFSFFDSIPKYLVYLFLFLSVLIVNFKYLKEDFITFKDNKKVYFKFIFKRYILMLGLMILVAVPIILINKGQVSSNQAALNVMFKKVPILTLLLSTIYAPFVEESIFRLTLSKIITKKTLFIIISGILFGTLHMIDKFTSIYDLLYIFQYSALGICLAKAYSDSKNIFVSIGMHFIQNFLAAILILILYI